MRTGSVIVDLAVETGGNCELAKRNEVVDADGVKIVGFDNLPGELPKDASTLFAKTSNFLSPHVNKESKSLEFDWEDETVKNTLVTKDGSVVNEIVKEFHNGFFKLIYNFCSCSFCRFYVVWGVTPALHSPLLAVTNAISSVIIVEVIAAVAEGLLFSSTMGLIAALFASVNIFGGFMVAQRMLAMFKKKIKSR